MTITGSQVQPGYDPPPLPALSPETELALLVRVLARYGYDDLRAGHVTFGQPDGTILINRGSCAGPRSAPPTWCGSTRMAGS